MKYLSLLFIVFIGVSAQAQKEKKQKFAPLNLKNAVIVGHLDNPDERYSLEINMTDLFSNYGVTCTPSLNLLKMGSDSRELANDSIIETVKAEGYDTYVLFTVKGYDRRFKVSNLGDDFATAIDQGSFYELHRLDVVSVSFEIKFFRDGKCVNAEIVKCGNVSDRETVLKRLRKKVGKRLKKSWRKS